MFSGFYIQEEKIRSSFYIYYICNISEKVKIVFKGYIWTQNLKVEEEHDGFQQQQKKKKNYLLNDKITVLLFVGFWFMGFLLFYGVFL